jgi:murein DD-endopeptidase MepM/ murein hydrolase activator NlpD
MLEKSMKTRRSDAAVWAALLQLGAGVVLCGGEPQVNEAPEAAPIRHYSSQTFVCLDPGETYLFKLKNGSVKSVRLASVKEFKDSVVSLTRRAEVGVEIDGQRLDLVSAPYVMPTETGGIRIQADTTSAWQELPKRVQFSLWDATDPIVDTRRFGFPLANYRLFSQGTQAYDEAVHLGAGDGDPAGQRFHHDYGFDLAGYEGREEVVSAVEGRIIKFWPSRDDPCSVLIQGASGLIWEHAHLKTLAPELALGAQVAKGQKLGLLGKTGPSGNFSHLHVGTYLSRREQDLDRPNRRLNLYPWLVTAYQSQHPQGLCAVARPHQLLLAGEKAILDGGNSLAWGGRRITEWRWTFPDGQTVRQPRAEKRFDQPGAHVATLWVKDDQGTEDVDFCQVKVFSKANPEKAMPHIFATHTPTQGIRPGQPVTFRLWLQGQGDTPLKVDFGQGPQVADYRSYSELQHSFKTPGIHVITAQCILAGLPITQKQKVVVTPVPPSANP